MRPLKDILLISFLATCAVGCIDDTEQLPVVEDVSYINLQISTGASTGSSQTRADSDVKSQSGENKINSVKVWMFGTCLNEAGVTQGSRELVGYAENTNFGFEVTESKLYEYIQIAVANKYLVNKNQTVDIYVIANAESVGLGSLGEGTSEADLQAAVIEQAYFGATNPVSGPTYISGETAATSLPASRIVTGVKLADLKPDLTAENRAKIVLQRAVSRIRFFAVKDAADTDLKLEGITIKGYKAAQGDEAGHDGFIPDRINIFPESVTYNSNRNALDLTTHGSWPKATVAQIPGDAVYTTSDIVYSTAGESAVAVDKYVENVETYFTKGTDETWQAYSDRLENNTNLYNVTYLRETVNKPLSVIIKYNGKEQTVQLTEDIQKLFLRNSDIIVGMYLIGTKFELKIYAVDWADEIMTVDYKDNPAFTDQGQFTWKAGTYNSEAVEDGFNIIYVKPGTELEASFALKSPLGWEWFATLTKLEGEDGVDFFKFSNNDIFISGSIVEDMNATLTIKFPSEAPSVRERAQLRLFVRLGTEQIKEVYFADNKKYVLSRSN